MELREEVAITIEEFFNKIINENKVSDKYSKDKIKELATQAVDTLFSNYEDFRKCLLGKMEFDEFKKMSENNEAKWKDFYENKFSKNLLDKDTKDKISIVFLYIMKEFEQNFFDWVLNTARKNKKE